MFIDPFIGTNSLSESGIFPLGPLQGRGFLLSRQFLSLWPGLVCSCGNLHPGNQQILPSSHPEFFFFFLFCFPFVFYCSLCSRGNNPVSLWCLQIHFPNYRSWWSFYFVNPVCSVGSLRATSSTAPTSAVVWKSVSSQETKPVWETVGADQLAMATPLGQTTYVHPTDVHLLELGSVKNLTIRYWFKWFNID